METFGSRIILLRERADITQVKLSKIVGVTKSTMSKYENGISIPNAELIGRIAAALNTSADYLVGNTADCSPHKKGKEWVQLSDNDQKLLNRFRLLSERNKIKALERIDTLLDEQSQRK